MNQVAIFWPMIAHAALVAIIYVLLGVRRQQAVRNGGGKMEDFRDNRAEPQLSLSARNNLANQFELPVLFHIACLSLYAVKGADLTAVVIAWLFVASRYLHAAAHVTSNRLALRSPLFLLGTLLVTALWVWLAVRLIAAG